MENYVGIILPPIIEVVNKDVTRDDERFIVALAICFLVAALIKEPQLASGDTHGFLAMFGIVFAETMATFKLYWKDSFLRDKLQNVLTKSGGE